MPAFLDATGLSKLLQKIKTVFATKTELDDRASALDSEVSLLHRMVPVGSVFYLAFSTIPSGYLLCNGQAVSRTTYSDLFAAIGTTYGTGNGSTTFNVPNLIDRFAQGASSPGTYVNAGLPNITGHFRNLVSTYGDYMGSANGCFYTGSNPGDVACKGNDGTYTGVSNNDGIGFQASRSSDIYGASATVQPPALTLVPVIRAKP